MKGLGILLAKVVQNVEKSVVSVEKKSQGLTDAFYDCEKDEKTFWFCDLCLRPCSYSRDASSKTLM